MKDLSKKELLWYLPIFYFILLALWAFVDNVVNARTQVGNFLIPSIVLLALLLTKNYRLQIIIGVILLLWSGLLILAYFSDAAKIVVFDEKAINFLFYGGLITLLNLLMSILLLFNDLHSHRRKINVPSTMETII